MVHCVDFLFLSDRCPIAGLGISGGSSTGLQAQTGGTGAKRNQPRFGEYNGTSERKELMSATGCN